MSLSQPNLHKYFKVKKQCKNSLVKDNKSDLKNVIANVKTEQVSLTKIEHEDCTASQSTQDLQLKDNCSATPTLLKNNFHDNVAKSETASPTGNTSDVNILEGSHITSKKRKRLNDFEDNESSTTPEPHSEEGDRVEMKISAAKRRLILGTSDEEKKKLDPQTIKEQLGKCGRLDELRTKLLQLNNCDKKLQAFRNQGFRKESPVKPFSPKKHIALRENHKCSSFTSRSKISPHNSPLKDRKTLSPHQLKSFDSLNIEVPVSPSRSPAKLARTPVKTCSERFSHLVEPSSQLVMPQRYRFIKEAFRAVDTVVSLLHNRQELITYSKLKPAVQEMLRKTFCENHLGQLKTVFPLAYFFSQEKVKGLYTPLANNYQLTLKPNFDYKIQHSVSRNLMHDLDVEQKGKKFRKMGPAVLVERREIFHSSLLNILKKHHTKFLETLDPPILLSGPIYRWHPDFPVEDIATPDAAALPQPPVSEVFSTAKDILDKAKDSFSVNNRMQKALECALPSSVTTLSQCSDNSSSTAISDNKQVATALKGISLSLLEKIRAREASKATKEMTRSSGASRELEMLSRLPELARILRSLFITEKKAALPWEPVMRKIVSSHSSSLSSSEAEGHVELLMKELPGWCTKHKVRSGIYLKIDQARQLTEITNALNEIVKERT